jgi:hypothetical protein
MADQDDQTTSSGSEQNPQGQPSQAEGSRETVEADLGERGQSQQEQDGTEQSEPTGQPSQAEGDRETVDESLNRVEPR